jgi:tetratricopeptide (TPR) repeat protein
MQLDTAASPFTVESVMNATRLLSDMQRGDADAASQLLNLVQSELRHIAGKLWGEGQPGQTLQPTIRLFQQALELNPFCDMAAMGCGVCLFQQGKTREAVEWIERALRLNPNNQQARRNLRAVKSRL